MTFDPSFDDWSSRELREAIDENVSVIAAKAIWQGDRWRFLSFDELINHYKTNSELLDELVKRAEAGEACEIE